MHLYVDIKICFLMVPSLIKDLEVLCCCSKRASWWENWAPRGTFAFCSWLEEHGITRNDLRPSCPYPGPGGNEGWLTWVGLIFPTGLPGTLALGAMRDSLPSLPFWSQFLQGKGSLGETVSTPISDRQKAGTPKLPFVKSPTSRHF